MPDLTELQRLAEGATPCDGWYVLKHGHGSDVRGRHVTGGSTWVAECRTDAEAAYIAAMSPDTAKKLIAVARAGLSAHREIQRFKMRWLNLPTFADKLNKTTRQAMTMAHQPIMMAEEVLRTALEELK